MSAVIDRASVAESLKRIHRRAAFNALRESKARELGEIAVRLRNLLTTPDDQLLILRACACAAADADKRIGGTSMVVIVDRLDELCDEVDGAK